MIMKKLTALAFAVAGFSAPAFAVDVASPTFNVSVTLTSVCKVKTNVGSVAFGPYTAFQTTAITPTVTSAVVECTRGRLVAPTVAFDIINGTTSAAAATVTGEGVLKGLRYTLATLAPTTVAGVAATAGALGLGGSNGTATDSTYSIIANMAAGQAGNEADAIASHVRTLTFTY